MWDRNSEKVMDSLCEMVDRLRYSDNNVCLEVVEMTVNIRLELFVKDLQRSVDFYKNVIIFSK
ncbi:hypothetical protein HNR31_003488 [Anoxybacillus caldiproteolyticus]|uniref:Uncharacterized protein n=1 Tax=Thermaerobacillus caldiproteolyticus TaxID=247480 RepID=A0A7W0C0E2_9BACL|nr:hypothetical protein [Anoxybacillus caldiproteolyticus]